MMGISSSRSILSTSSSLLFVFFAAVVSSQNLCSRTKPRTVVGCCVNKYRSISRTGFVVVRNATNSGLDASVVFLLLLSRMLVTMAAAFVVVVVILEPRTTSSAPSSYEDNSPEHEDGVATRTDPSFRDEDNEASGDDRDEGSTRQLGCSMGFFGRITRVRSSFVRRGVGEASITALGRWTTVSAPSLLSLFLDDRVVFFW